MHYTYVLYSPSHNKIYIGFTSNLDARLQAHNSEFNKGYTKRFSPWKLAYFEKYETKSEARKRELQLKTGRGRKFIWEEIIPNIKK